MINEDNVFMGVLDYPSELKDGWDTTMSDPPSIEEVGKWIWNKKTLSCS